MVPFATLTADMDTVVMVQCAGNIAHLDSEMMEHIAESHHHTAEEQAMPYGTRVSARVTSLKDAKSTVLCITQDVQKGSIMLGAVFAPLTA
jgi:hypothetical protein